MKRRYLRTIVLVTAALTVTTLVLQGLLLRPRLFPAGAGLALSGDRLMAALAEPVPIPFVRPPAIRELTGQPIRVSAVHPGGPADRAGIRVGQIVTSVSDGLGQRVELGAVLPGEPRGVLELWRQIYRLSVSGPITLELEAAGNAPTRVVLDRPPVWSLDGETLVAWLQRRHFGPVFEQFAFAFAALLMVALGARGISAHLMTLAFLLMGAADTGLLFGAWRQMPIAGPALMVFTWLATALAFPAIGLAVLYFPKRSTVLDRQKWVVPALWLVAVPCGVIGLLSSAFLLGADSVATALAWVAARPWIYSVGFGVGLATNIIVVTEGVHRYRTNPDANERRRIETVVFTAVPATAAYMISTGLPIVGSAFGWDVRLPWPVMIVLQMTTLLTAAGLAYAVAVRRAFSTRTVLRRSLQYAFARKTLAVVALLPVAALVFELVRQRDQPLDAIISGQPRFYLICLALIGASLRYRVAVERWLDRQFFRSEYDARQILVSLASKVPYESDPKALVSLVQTEISSALHPESTAVLIEASAGYETVASHGARPGPLAAASPLVQLLRWSDQPLEVVLDDERSPIARLPPADREWLAAAGAALLVPISAGSGDAKPLVGILALGQKRSDEPYTSEDRELLAATAAQMGVALDLSRLRRLLSQTPQVSQTPQAQTSRPPSGIASDAPTMMPPASGLAIDVGHVVEGKYRIDELIGRGGMGAVFRARDLRLERDVAIKIVRAELVSSPESRERFRREAQMAARLQHPAIVTVFDFGTLADGTAYLVMEYVRGEDLRGRLARGEVLSPADCSKLLAGIADGIEAAHREGILHRDLKPENILLPEAGSGPKVLDFGIAKATTAGGTELAGATFTAAGTIIGTPAYMAPEQLRGETLDARADVYSLGVMTYEAMTGRLPYGTGTFIDVAMRQAKTELSVDTSNLPPAVASVLLRAIAFARDERPPTPAAFADAMATALRQ